MFIKRHVETAAAAREAGKNIYETYSELRTSERPGYLDQIISDMQRMWPGNEANTVLGFVNAAYMANDAKTGSYVKDNFLMN